MERDGIVSIDQFTTGMQFNFPRIAEEETWDDWYHGDFGRLFPTPTIANGLKLLIPKNGEFDLSQLFKFNVFQNIADFYANAVFSERPALNTDSPAIEDFVQLVQERLYRVLRNASFKWAVKSRFIVVTFEDGTVREVDPSNYFRIGSEEDEDEEVGHIIAERYRHRDANELLLPQVRLQDNRVRVFKYDPLAEVNTVQTFEYAPNVIGQPITEEEPASITAICLAGEGDSWFRPARDTVARYVTRLTNLDRDLNRMSNKPVYVPGQAISQTQAGDTRTATERVRDYEEDINPVIEVLGNQNVTGGVLTNEPPLSESMEMLEFEAQLITHITGVSPVTYGIGISRNASGYARERAQDAAAIRVRNLRNELAICLPKILRGMGAPEGDMTFSWSTSPFEDRVARAREIREDVNAGIIPPSHAARLLGYEVEDEIEETE